jgi:hypothetical protein
MSIGSPSSLMMICMVIDETAFKASGFTFYNNIIILSRSNKHKLPQIAFVNDLFNSIIDFAVDYCYNCNGEIDAPFASYR